MSGGDPAVAEFPVGGGATDLAGVTCITDGITVTEAPVTGDMSGDECSFGTVTHEWVTVPGELQGTQAAAVILNHPADDDTIFSASEFSC